MTDGLQVSIDGIEAINEKLKSLSNDAKFKGGRFALRKAANLIAEQIKQNVRTLDDPNTPENIEKNIAVRFSTRAFKNTGLLKFRIGVLGGAKKGSPQNPGGDTFYWRFLEFGTEKMRARAPLRKGAQQKSNDAFNEFVKQYDKAIDRAIKRAKKV